MKQFRLSTLLLLVVIAALCVAMIVQQKQAAQREADLRAALENQSLNLKEYLTQLYSANPRPTK